MKERFKMSSKQVLVMRQFENLRTGKYIAQGAHGSVGALLSVSRHDIDNNCLIIPLHDNFIREWILGSFTKITVYVKTEAELLALHSQAKELGLPAALIQDAGRTEFKGVPTYTCLGIGPGNPAVIDSVTGSLPLF